MIRLPAALRFQLQQGPDPRGKSERPSAIPRGMAPAALGRGRPAASALIADC